jgi:hypothetical protein
LTTGSSIGAKITMAGPVSITIPMSRNIATIIPVTAAADVKLPSMNAETMAGAYRSVRTFPNATANARRKHNGA